MACSEITVAACASEFEFDTLAVADYDEGVNEGDERVCMDRSGGSDVSPWHKLQTPPASASQERFSIREFVANVRKTDIRKCWPFSERLLHVCLRDGPNPPLPSLDAPAPAPASCYRGHREVKQEALVYRNGKLQESRITDLLADKQRDAEAQHEKLIEQQQQQQQETGRHSEADGFHVSGQVYSDFTAEEEDSSKAKKGCRQQQPLKGLVHSKISQEDKRLADADDAERSAPVLSHEEETAQPVIAPADRKVLANANGRIAGTGTDVAASSSAIANGKKWRQQGDNAVRENAAAPPQKKIPEDVNSNSSSDPRQPEGMKESSNSSNNAKRGGSNDCNNLVSDDGPCIKQCPVCKTFTSSTINAVNAHMDNCLSQVSDAAASAPEKLQRRLLHHGVKLRPQKKRSIVDIFACTPLVQQQQHAQTSADEVEAEAVSEDGSPCDDDKAAAAADLVSSKDVVRNTKDDEPCAMDVDQFRPRADSSPASKRLKNEPIADSTANVGDFTVHSSGTKRRRRNFVASLNSTGPRRVNHAIRKKTDRKRSNSRYHGIRVASKKTMKNSRIKQCRKRSTSALVKKAKRAKRNAAAIKQHSKAGSSSPSAMIHAACHSHAEQKADLIIERTKTDDGSSSSTISNVVKDAQASIQSIDLGHQKINDEQVAESCRLQTQDQNLDVCKSPSFEDGICRDNGSKCSSISAPAHQNDHAASLTPDLASATWNATSSSLPEPESDGVQATPQPSELLLLENAQQRALPVFPRDSKGRFMKGSNSAGKASGTKRKRRSRFPVESTHDDFQRFSSVHEATNFAINAAFSINFAKSSAAASQQSGGSIQEKSCSVNKTAEIPDLNAVVPEEEKEEEEAVDAERRDLVEITLPDESAANQSQATKEQQMLNCHSFVGSDSKQLEVGLPLDSQGVLVQGLAKSVNSDVPFSSTDLIRLPNNGGFDSPSYASKGYAKVSPVSHGIPSMPWGHFQEHHALLPDEQIQHPCTGTGTGTGDLQMSRRRDTFAKDSHFFGDQRVVRLMGKSFLVEDRKSQQEEDHKKLQDSEMCRETVVSEDFAMLSETVRSGFISSSDEHSIPSISANHYNTICSEADLLQNLERYSAAQASEKAPWLQNDAASYLFSSNRFSSPARSEQRLGQQAWESAGVLLRSCHGQSPFLSSLSNVSRATEISRSDVSYQGTSLPSVYPQKLHGSQGYLGNRGDKLMASAASPIWTVDGDGNHSSICKPGGVPVFGAEAAPSEAIIRQSSTGFGSFHSRCMLTQNGFDYCSETRGGKCPSSYPFPIDESMLFQTHAVTVDQTLQYHPHDKVVTACASSSSGRFHDFISPSKLRKLNNTCSMNAECSRDEIPLLPFRMPASYEKETVIDVDLLPHARERCQSQNFVPKRKDEACAEREMMMMMRRNNMYEGGSGGNNGNASGLNWLANGSIIGRDQQQQQQDQPRKLSGGAKHILMPALPSSSNSSSPQLPVHYVVPFTSHVMKRRGC